MSSSSSPGQEVDINESQYGPYPGFETAYTDCPSGARVFSYRRDGELARTDSTLPVLVLLHGYPQNSLMYKQFIDEIPRKWRLLIPDLPGYGNSTKPISSDSYAHSKRAWGEDILAVVDTLFPPPQTNRSKHTNIIVLGHDRGARLAYRLALDAPERVCGAVLLDIVPTVYVWDAMRVERGHNETKKSHHWITLAAPRPLPETLIASSAEFYFNYTLTGWASRDSELHNPKHSSVIESIAPFLDPDSDRAHARIAAVCEDYRAGATHDVEHDLAAGINPFLLLAQSPALLPFTGGGSGGFTGTTIAISESSISSSSLPSPSASPPLSPTEATSFSSPTSFTFPLRPTSPPSQQSQPLHHQHHQHQQQYQHRYHHQHNQNNYHNTTNYLQASTPARTPPFGTTPLLVLSSHHLRARFDVDTIWKSLGSRVDTSNTPSQTFPLVSTSASRGVAQKLFGGIGGSVKSYGVGDERTGHFIVQEAQWEVGGRVRVWLNGLEDSLRGEN